MKDNNKGWSIIIAMVTVFLGFGLYMEILQNRDSRQMRNQIISNQFAIVNNQKIIIDNQDRLMQKFEIVHSTNPFFMPKE